MAEQLLEILRMSNALEEMLVDRILQGIEEGRAMGLAAGRTMGIEEGRTEGRAEGVILGRQEALQKVLERRFGTLAPSLSERLGLVRDERHLETLLDAERLEDVDRALPPIPS